MLIRTYFYVNLKYFDTESRLASGPLVEYLSNVTDSNGTNKKLCYVLFLASCSLS